MFIVVKFGENEEEIFNPNCRAINLLSNIKEKCRCDYNDVELSDENGNVKNLRESPQRYASEVVKERETFVLLRVDKADGGDPQYIPMLYDNETIITEAFLAQLASRPNSKRSQRRGASGASSFGAKKNLKQGRDTPSRHSPSEGAKPKQATTPTATRSRSKGRTGK